MGLCLLDNQGKWGGIIPEGKVGNNLLHGECLGGSLSGGVKKRGGLCAASLILLFTIGD